MSLCLLGDVFEPIEFLPYDLMAVDILRGRDQGLADYNTIRVELGLPRITNWTEINPLLYQTEPQVCFYFYIVILL